MPVLTGLTACASVCPRTAMVLSAVWPFILFQAYAFLNHKFLSRNKNSLSERNTQELSWLGSSVTLTSGKLRITWSVLRHLSLLFVVYLSVYLTLGAVLTTMVYDNERGPPEYVPRDHFLSYVLSTLVGEFLGRALMSVLHAVTPGFSFTGPSILAAIPVVQAIFFLVSTWYRVVPSLWINWLLCFVMGTTAGMTFTNSFRVITTAATPTHGYLLVICATVAESAGVLTAGLLGLYVEPILKEHCLQAFGNHTWCLTRSEDPLFWVNG